MNFLAHGFRHLGDPWFVAGTALPDWLRVLDRRARVRPEALAAPAADADPRVASMARGALRHHEDDRRFHGSEAFAAARHEVAEILRAALPEEDGHRPSFIAHVLVEVQLDASIAASVPDALEGYYRDLASLDPEEVEEVARRVAPELPAGMARLVRAFVREKFVADYAEPRTLLARLDRAVRRARQPALPAGLADLLPATRAAVEARRDELLG